MASIYLTNKSLRSTQIGFLRGYRTTDHIFSLGTLIDKYAKNENRGKLFCCFVDFQKAFDSVYTGGTKQVGAFLTFSQICTQNQNVPSDVVIKEKISFPLIGK